MSAKQFLITLIWSFASLFLQAQTPFYDGNQKLWGYKNGRGKIIIPAQFEDPYPYSKVLKKIALPARFQKIRFDSLNQIFIVQAENLHLYNSEGEKINYPQSSDYKILKRNYYALKTAVGWSIFKLKPAQQFSGHSTICPSVKTDSFIIKQGDYYRVLDSAGQFRNEKRYRDSDLKRAYFKYSLRSASKSWTSNIYADTILELAPQIFVAKLQTGYRIFKIEAAKIELLNLYQAAKPLTKTLIAVKNDAFWGAINLEGQPIIPFKYLKIERHNERYLKVLDQAARCRIFDLKQRQWFENQHYIIRPEGNLFLAKQQNRYGYLDTAGRWTIPPDYEYLSSPIGNWVCAKKDGYFGIIDSENRAQVSFLYDSLILVNEHYLVYFENSEWGTWTRSGLELARHTASFRVLPNGCLKLDSLGRQGFVNQYGTLALPTRYDSLSEDIRGGLLAVYQEQDTTYMDLNETILPPPKYQVLDLQRDFTDGYIPAQALDGAWGFIDYRGQWRISNRYDSLKSFSEGYAPFKLNGSWGYLDKRERIQIQPIYQSVSKVRKNLAVVQKDGYYGLLNLQTRTYLIPLKYDKIVLNGAGNYLLERAGKLGWFRAESETNNVKLGRIYPKYSHIRELNDDFLLVGDNGKWGVDRTDGRSIFLPRYKSILYFRASKCFALRID